MINKIYFPYISKAPQKIYKSSKFSIGAAMGAIYDIATYKKLNLSAVLFNNFLWSKFEPIEGTFDYNYFNNYFDFFQKVVDAGIPPIVPIGGIPLWAQENPLGCSPIKINKIDSYVFMVNKILKNVSNLIYIQIMNEVDNPDGYDDHYGCFGDIERYILVMEKIYPLKLKFPHIKISMGLTSYYSGNFFKDYIEYGGNNYVDIYNVHFYNGWEQKNPPLLSSEIDAIRCFSNNDIWITEANLLHDGEISETYLNDQASWIYEQSNLSEKLKVMLFSPYALISNWRNADILKRPAEQVLQNLCAEKN